MEGGIELRKSIRRTLMAMALFAGLAATLPAYAEPNDTLSTYPVDALPSTETAPLPTTIPDSGASQQAQTTTTVAPLTDEDGQTMPPPPSRETTTKPPKTTKPPTTTTKIPVTKAPTTTTARTRHTVPYIWNPEHPEDTYSGVIPKGSRYTWEFTHGTTTGTTVPATGVQSSPDFTLPNDTTNAGLFSSARMQIAVGAVAALLLGGAVVFTLIRKSSSANYVLIDEAATKEDDQPDA